MKSSNVFLSSSSQRVKEEVKKKKTFTLSCLHRHVFEKALFIFLFTELYVCLKCGQYFKNVYFQFHFHRCDQFLFLPSNLFDPVWDELAVVAGVSVLWRLLTQDILTCCFSTCLRYILSLYYHHHILFFFFCYCLKKKGKTKIREG